MQQDFLWESHTFLLSSRETHMVIVETQVHYFFYVQSNQIFQPTF